MNKIIPYLLASGMAMGQKPLESYLPKDKPATKCLQCGKDKWHNNSWCSAECCKKWKAENKKKKKGERTMEKETNEPILVKGKCPFFKKGFCSVGYKHNLCGIPQSQTGECKNGIIEVELVGENQIKYGESPIKPIVTAIKNLRSEFAKKLDAILRHRKYQPGYDDDMINLIKEYNDGKLL